MSGVHIESVRGDVRIRAVPGCGPFQPSVEHRVAELWSQAMRQCGASLLDGQLFSLDAPWDGKRQEITGQFVAYRYYIAQRLDPSLENTVRVRPLAITGAVFCLDGLVIGKRLHTAAQDPGAWEIVPSGGIEPECLRADGYVDPVLQLRRELREELGLDTGTSAVPVPLCSMVEGVVTDLVFRLDASVGRAEVSARFARLASPEHSAIDFVEPAGIGAELSGGRHWSVSSRALLGELAAGLAVR